MSACVQSLPVQSYLLAVDGAGAPWATLERCPQRHGPDRWAVRRPMGWCLGKDGEFDAERSPSARTPELLANTRFDTPDQAHAAWLAYFTRARDSQDYELRGIRLA